MDYQQFVHQVLAQHNVNASVHWNSLQPPWSLDGWQLKLPPLHSDWLILHFQDRVTSHGQGCRELEVIEQYYGNQAHRVAVICYAHGMDRVYQGPVKILNFSSHNWLTIHDLQAREHLWRGQFDQPKTQAWQCLNGKIMPHRYRVANVVKHWSGGTLSLGSEIPLPEWPYTTYIGTENYDNFERLQWLYQKSAVNIVSESQYDARPGVISEKTLYAFVACQVPIVIGHPGAVQDCRDFGFDMFDDIVDTSYDWAPNDQRIELALNLNRDFAENASNTDALRSRLIANQQHALTGYLQWMQQKFTTDVTRLLTIQERQPLI
jgi:hypothetical protein